MRHKLLYWVPVLLLVSMAALAATLPSSTPQHFVLRVNSAVPGTEVQFEGTYMFNGSDSSIHSVRQSTPFEASADGVLGVGVFRKTGGASQLVVEIQRFVDNKPVGSTRAQDDGVIFAENLVDGHASFCRTFASAVK